MSQRMPVTFIPHGGGPWPFVDLGIPPAEREHLANYLMELPALLPEPPRALLVVSAHWEERVPTVMTSPKPPLYYDYYGFPPASYELTWPAPGDPALAQRVQELLGAAGFETAANDQRGFDHGTFVPLKLSYPNANVPTVQLSLIAGLDPAAHLKMGAALRALRDEGVFIVGSGMSFHDLRAFRSSQGKAVATEFDAWLRESVPLPAAARNQRLLDWAKAPAARQAHPREEHLIPLLVAAGAAGDDVGSLGYHGKLWGIELSGYHFGTAA